MGRPIPRPILTPGNSSQSYLESCIIRSDGGSGVLVTPNHTNASIAQLVDSKLHLDSWDEPSVFLNLILFVVFKFILTAVSITMAIPCGVFTPVFAIGAGVGRFFGELTVVMGGNMVIAGGYAVVGAAVFTAGTTGTVSIAVIIFELTSQLNYMLPVLFAVLIGRALGKRISGMNIYDSIARERSLPALPALRSQSAYSTPIASVMVEPTSYVAIVQGRTRVCVAVVGGGLQLKGCV